MKEEKVMYVDLPEDAEYRKAYVTEDGKVAIAYAEETVNDTVKVSKTVSKAIPKPTPLIGGTEVYQKEGTPYWFCKIKDGRDEFMHLYFGDLTNDDVLYTADGKKRKFITERQKKFRADVMKALENMPKEGFRWIPVYEPSEDSIVYYLDYISGKNVAIWARNAHEWERALEYYSCENGSQMTSITTYFLLLLRLLKDGFATIEQLADDSTGIGHYCDSENAKHKLEKTGERQFAGLYGFAGNTFKIVKDSESRSGFSLLGGSFHCSGNICPLAHVSPCDASDRYGGDFPRICDGYSFCGYGKIVPNYASDLSYYGVGLLELTK